jgi:endonuclease-3
MTNFSRANIIKRAAAIDKILARSYGAKTLVSRSDPTSELVLTILSQNTNDFNRDKAFAELKRHFPTWRDVASARPQDIARAIKVGGLSKIKSTRIKKILNQISASSSDYSLAFLEKMPDREIWNYLISFNGVGPKTASCVLLFGLGRHAMPVDTHVYRVGRRLDLIPEKLNPEQAHQWFLDLELPLNIYQLHINMIGHGRKLCRPRNPKCPQCPLKRSCRYFKEHVAAGASAR